MSTSLHSLEQQLRSALGDRVRQLDIALGELTLEVPAAELTGVMHDLRDRPEFLFAQLIDLCGLDYRDHARASGPRFAVVYHLLSIVTFCPGNFFFATTATGSPPPGSRA